jgi:trimeric autotransporter adhesin
MIKKIAYAGLMALLLLPMLLLTPLASPAANMQVTSSALPASGGSINPNGLKFFSGAANYTITVNSGWSISSVLIDNVASPNGNSTSQIVPFDTSKVHTIKATFSQGTYSITTSTGPGGLIQVTGGGPTGISSGSSRTVIISPLTGYRTHSYIVDGGSPVVPANPYVSASISFNNITANHNVSATFDLIPMITVTAGGDQTIEIGPVGTASTTLSGSATSNSGAISYLWTIVSKPDGSTPSFSAPTNASTSFSADKLGLYKVTLTATSGGLSIKSSPASITVTSATLLASSSCIQCHTGAAQVSQWLSSAHGTSPNGASCPSCHMPNNEAHPGQATSSMANICLNCHLGTPEQIAAHPLEIGTNTCTTCHNPHSLVAGIQGSPHYNNITSGMYPASYVSSKATCSNCHVSNTLNKTVRHQWDRSGHADTKAMPWVEYDFKTMSGCVQCHTTTGFIAYSTGKVTASWGGTPDKTKEVLTCVGCHSDIANGVVRTVTPVKPFTNDSYVNRNVGISNICMDCHSGRNNGLSIKSVDFGNQPFIAPHYLAAGGVLHGKGGYNSPGQPYAFYSSNTHRTIGMGNSAGTGTDGPCVACHMSAPDKHLFKAVSTATGGTINKVTADTCAKCHGTSLDDTSLLNARKTSFNNALDVLRQTLANRGFIYSPTYPYFTNTDWTHFPNAASTMGAAFNYVLLLKEPGAYAHNAAYTKQMILDSIDFAYNGSITGNIDNVVNNLVGNGINQDQANNLLAYKNSSLCTTCHGGTPATTTPMATNAHGVHLTAPYGPGSYLGNDIRSCQTCHIYSTVTHINGIVDLVNGSGSACANCHPGTLPIWSNNSRINCTDCHAAIPSVLPNGIAAPYKANFSLRGHGQYSASNQCTICHDSNSSHISGSLGTYTRLILANDNTQCASCHNNAAIVRSAFRNMSTHVTIKGGGQTMLCNVCHDPHGSTNLSMIRTIINGQNIVFVNRTTGFVNSSNNRGLCQVCHTLTAHYRAGIPETSHPTINCLSCHKHNTAGGAFKPNGSCDTCHGYPPASQHSTMMVNFGTMNNWSSARFEDYSGGGGAHLVAGHVPKTAKSSEGWANCTPCHSGAGASHTMTLPIRDHVNNVNVSVDQQFSFQGANPVYDSTTKTCSNVSCHSVPAGTFSYYFQGGDGSAQLNTVNYGGTAHQTPQWTNIGAQCTACHDNPPYNAPNQYVWHSGWHGGVNLTSTRNPDVLGYNKCDLCHSDVSSTITGTPGSTSAQMTTTILNTSMHRNGIADVQGKFESRCFGCH